MIGGCHKDSLMVRVRFHARTPHILMMADLFFVTYAELALLTRAWKMQDALAKVVVHIMIELASNPA